MAHLLGEGHIARVWSLTEVSFAPGDVHELRAIFWPQISKAQTYDFIWSLPVPRLAAAASTFTVFTLMALPGVAVALGVGVWNFDIALEVSWTVVPAVVITSLAATSVGFGLAHAVMIAERFFNHALFNFPDHLRWTAKYNDEVLDIPASKNPLLLDHILLSQPLCREKFPIVANEYAGKVEHETYERCNAGARKNAMTSDHRPVTCIFDPTTY